MPDIGPMRLKNIMVAGPAGRLEGLLQEGDDPLPAVTAIVCHPHPLYGGTFHNKVVHRVAATLHRLGAAVLRFNFRGVGRSEGRFSDGFGELEDAAAALAWLRERHPEARRWIAGFSFGSWVAARLAAREGECERLILVAPPVGKSDFESMRDTPVPKLVIQGTRDQTCPLVDLEREFPTWAEPKKLVRIEGASHFFDRQLHDLANAIVEELSTALKGKAS